MVADHPERGETPGPQTHAPPALARARRRALELVATAAPGSPISLTPLSPRWSVCDGE